MKLNVNEAAEYLGMRPESLRNAVYKKRVPFHKTTPFRNGKLYFLKDELDKFIKARDGKKAIDEFTVINNTGKLLMIKDSFGTIGFARPSKEVDESLVSFNVDAKGISIVAKRRRRR